MGNLITYENWENPSHQFTFQDKLKGSVDVLKWAFNQYQENIVYACSFGIEGIVLIDLISQVKENATIAFLDTDLHFKETYELIEKVKKRYPKLKIKMVKSNLSLVEQEKKFGEQLWERKPNQCCYYRKVVPLENVLSKYGAWISGLRREQSDTRKNVEFVNKDERFKSIKVCPLIHWTWDNIWNYVKQHELPYNPLHDQGYPSIGCFPCTSPVVGNEDTRSGRWKNQDKTECGLHQ